MHSAVVQSVEVFLNGSNLLDEEARPHNPPLKYIAPLSGRGFQVGVTVKLCARIRDTGGREGSIVRHPLPKPWVAMGRPSKAALCRFWRRQNFSRGPWRHSASVLVEMRFSECQPLAASIGPTTQGVWLHPVCNRKKNERP